MPGLMKYREKVKPQLNKTCSPLRGLFSETEKKNNKMSAGHLSAPLLLDTDRGDRMLFLSHPVHKCQDLAQSC